MWHVGPITNNCDYLPHTTFRFYSVDFQLHMISISNFSFFTVKSENAFETSKNPLPFLYKTVGLTI